MTPQPNADWYALIPKVELHLHLEGAIPLAALWELVQKYGAPSVPDQDALERRFAYQDFAHFLEAWRWKNQFLRQYEDFALIAEAVALDLARQNIRYVEAFYSAPDFRHHGLETQRLTEAIRIGLDRVPGIEVALVADLVRDATPAGAAITLEEIREVSECGVVGIGLGGAEHKHPPGPFHEVYERARQYGFRTTAHAGEAAGPESIWGAVRALKVDRIGHGTRAEEDPALLAYLAEHRIPLEMCPTSNVRTGVVGSLREHPLRRYYELGILVTVNTDDPKMFGSSLAEEYRLLEEELGFSRDDIRTLILQAIRASWLPGGRRQSLEQSFVRDPAWRGDDEHGC